MIPKNANAMQIVVNIIANITEIVAKAWQIQLLLFCNFPEVFKIFLVHSCLNPQTWDPRLWGGSQLYFPKTKPQKGRNIYSGGQSCTPLSDGPRQKFPGAYF